MEPNAEQKNRDVAYDADRRMPVDAVDWIRRLIQNEASRSESRIRQQMDGIESLLGLKARARVLDLGCGSGRQTIELARRGYRVLGIDVSAAALAGARAAIRGQTLNVHFLAGDLRRIPYMEEFNAVINVQHPIGCFSAEREDLQCLQAVHRALKVGGKLLLDLVNREWLIIQLGPHLNATESIFDLHTGRLHCRGLFPSSRSAVQSESLRVYSLTEIRALLHRAGLVVKGAFGGFEGSPYGVASMRMIVLAEKRAPSDPSRKQDDLPRAMRIKGRPR